MGCKIRLAWSSVCALILFLSVAGSLGASPNSDDGFQPDLKSVTAFVVRPDGRVLAVNNSKEIVLLNADGSTSATYPATTDYTIQTIALQPDGKLLIGGLFNSVGGVTSRGIARLCTDGSVDASFSAAPFDTSVAPNITFIALQADGKILVAGEFQKIGVVERPTLARLNADGSLDASFNPITITRSYFNKNIVVQPDGKILFAGSYQLEDSSSYYTDFKRLNSDGSVDISFQPGYITNNCSYFRKMLLQPDGKILMGGNFKINGTEKTTVVRLASNGSPDASFQLDNGEWCYLEALQADGKMIGWGKWLVDATGHYGFMRFQPDGTIDPSYRYETGSAYQIQTVGIQPDGKLLSSGNNTATTNGSFTKIGVGLSRLNLDGSLDSNFDFALKTDAGIRVLARQPDGRILIGGRFTTINGVTRYRIARLNADGTFDWSFDPGIGPDGAVSGVNIQPNGKILIIGTFTSVAGAPRNRIARLNADGSLDTAYDPQLSGEGVFDFQADGKTVFVGFYASVAAPAGCGRLNADGSIDTAFKMPFASSDQITGARIQGQKVLVSGDFPSIGHSGRCLVRLNANGTVDSKFKIIGSDMNHYAGFEGAWALPDGKIVFTRSYWSSSKRTTVRIINCATADGVASESLLRPIEMTGSYLYEARQQADGKILLGGRFNYNGQTRFILRVNTDGDIDTSFNPVADGDVYAISAKDGKMLVAGEFMSVNDEPRYHLAQLNDDGLVDGLSNFLCSSPNGEVDALATDCNHGILIGGEFDTVYGTPRNGCARIGASGDFDSTFTAVTGQASATAALTDGKVLMCHGSGPYFLSRHVTDGTTDSAFAKVSVDARIECMAIQPSHGVVIAGGFHHVKNFVRNQIARVNEDGSLDVRFNAGDGVDLGDIVVPDDGTDDETGHDWIYHQSRGRISTIAVQPDGNIIIAGEFDRVAGVPRKNIARLMANGPIDRTFDPGTGADGQVFAAAIQTDGKILIAGEFTTVNGDARNGIARLNPDGSVDAGFVPDTSERNYFQTMALQADGKINVGGFYSSEKGHGRIARLNPDGSLDTLIEISDPLSFDFGGVHALALQCDGKLIVGGRFDHIGAVERRNIARMSSPDAALQSIEVAPGGRSVTWKMSGSHPQPYQVFFEDSSDGVTWNPLGWGTPVAGVGFRLNHLMFPVLTSHYVRATGWTTSGLNNGSVSLHRSALLFFAPSYNAASGWVWYE